MTRRSLFVVTALLGVLWSSALAAQDQPVVFVHGILSSKSTWDDAAQRLSTRLAIEVHKESTNSTATFENQAGTLQSYFANLPNSTIAIGHSNGGLVSREWSKTHGLQGIVTLGTPHGGAPILNNGYAFISFASAGLSLADAMIYLMGPSWTFMLPDIDWASEFIKIYISNWTRGMLSMLDPAFPVIPEMMTGSSYLGDLNGSQNLTREQSQIATRIGIRVFNPDFYWQGPFALFAPDNAALYEVLVELAGEILDYWADYIYLTADPYDSAAFSHAHILSTAAGWLMAINDEWCALISTTVLSQCTISDGLVPEWSQRYPGATVSVAVGNGPAHTRETQLSDDVIYNALTLYGLQVPPRSGSSASLSPSSATVGSSGGSISTALSIPQSSVWTTSASVSWLSVTPTTGTGPNNLLVTVAANQDGVVRTGQVSAGGASITITQEPLGSGCFPSLSYSSFTIIPNGGVVTVGVSAPADCSWSAASQAGWVHVGGGASGTGDGTVTLSIDATSGSISRVGSVLIGGQTFTVVQNGFSCTLSFWPLTHSIVPDGEFGRLINVTVDNPSCAWTASTDSSWITITGGASGAGDRTVTYAVSTNPGTSIRTGYIRIGDQILTVNQMGWPCTWGVSPTSFSIGDLATTRTFSVDPNRPTCEWTIASDVPWLWTTSGASGTGHGTVTFAAASNDHVTDRTGSIRVLWVGQTVRTITVTQASILGDSRLMVYDSFTATNGASLAGHTPDVSQLGSSWSVATGPYQAPTLQSGQVAGHGAAGFATQTLATISTGDPNATVVVDWNPIPGWGGGTLGGGLVYRFVDSQNYFWVQYFYTNLYLYRVQGGLPTLLNMVNVGEAAGSSHTLKVKGTGTAIQVWWDDISEFVVYDSFNQYTGRHGMALQDYATFDNFLAFGTPQPTIHHVTVTQSGSSTPMVPVFIAQAYDASNQPVYGVDYTWSSSNAAVMTVNATWAPTTWGSPHGLGSAIITATATHGPGGSITVSPDPHLLVYDSFTAADSTPLPGHVPDLTQVGGPWLVTGIRSATIQSGQAASLSGPNGVAFATIATGDPNATVIADWNPIAGYGGGTLGSGVVYRYLDTGNYFWAQYFYTNLYLYKYQNGIQTQLGIVNVGEASGSPHRLQVKGTASAIQVWWDGVLQLTATDSLNAFSGRHGLAMQGPVTFDNFVAIGTPLATVHHVNVSPTNITVNASSTPTFTAQAYDVNNQPIDGVEYTWSSSNTAVATITSTLGPSGLGQARGLGTTTITATPSRGPSASTPLSVTPGSMLLLDSFTGANGTLLSNHAPDFSANGAGWQFESYLADSPAITGNQAKATAGSGYWTAIDSIDTGVADVVLNVDWTPFAGGSAGQLYGGVVVRKSDAANQLRVYYYYTNVYLVRRQDNANYVVASANVGEAAGATHHLTVRAIGSNIRVFWDWVSVLNVTESFNASATRHGLFFAAPDSGSTFDNFRVDRNPNVQMIVNGVVQPSEITVMPGSTLSVQVSGGPAFPADMVGLYLWYWGNGAGPNWQYLNGTQTIPPAGLATSTMTFTVPNAPLGDYELRYSEAGTYLTLSKITVHVQLPPPQVVVNGISSGSTSAAVGATIPVTFAYGSGASNDWLAISPSGSPNTYYLTYAWVGTSWVAQTGGYYNATMNVTMPSTPGDYEVRWYASGTYTRTATGPTIHVQ